MAKSFRLLGNSELLVATTYAHCIKGPVLAALSWDRKG